MSSPFERPFEADCLPPHIVEELVRTILKTCPTLRTSFLASLGMRVHQATLNLFFKSLVIPDEATAVLYPRGPLAAVLANPARYAPVVRTLVIQDPALGLLTSHTPIPGAHVTAILDLCSNVEELCWKSSSPPPDGLCEMLSTRLTRFSYNPSAPTKWDAPSLPLLATSPLTSLSLARLSQSGAKAFACLLNAMGEYSSLEHLDVDFVWLDNPLCERIAMAGRRIRSLKMGTSGTKMMDKGIVSIMQGCDALEDFVMQDVQGRLSRTLWTKPSAYPSGLKTFRIVISEDTSHHSWTADHLLSLHSLPLDSIETLSIVRCEALPHLENGNVTFDNALEDFLAFKPVPTELVQALRDAKSLTKLECDWWSWGSTEVKTILESCTNIHTLKICVDTPFSKLLALTSAFASVPTLLSLYISIDPKHAPGKPPVPRLPTRHESSLPTPSGSPVLRTKAILPQLLEVNEQMMCSVTTTLDVDADPSMPLLRDVKRFVRKLPKLLLLEWYGKAGRGTWNVTRPASAKTSITVSVDYTAPVISESIWESMIAAPAVVGTEPREGQAWTTEAALALAAANVEEDQPPSSPTRARKVSAKPAAVNTSFPTTRTPSKQASLSPLTPPHSETSLSSLAEGVSKPQSGGRRRAPSESVTAPASSRTPANGRARAKSSSEGAVAAQGANKGPTVSNASNGGGGSRFPGRNSGRGGAAAGANSNSRRTSASRGGGRGGSSSRGAVATSSSSTRGGKKTTV